MILDKKDRPTLKKYFVRNAVPTEGNFAALIDGGVNQLEDGVARPAGEPLSVRAEADEQKRALNFYGSFDATAQPLWQLSLNPRSDPTKPGGSKAGFSIGDAKGISRLFIDQSSGNVGIGTVNVGAENKLQVAGHLHMDGNSIFFRGANPNDQRDLVRWNKSDDRLHVGGWNGVVLGHTQEGQNTVTPRLTVDAGGTTIVQPDWTAPTLAAPWKFWGAPFSPAGYFKDSLGIVHLRGLITGGSVSWDAAIFTLPAGYRPAAQRLFAVNAVHTMGRLDIKTNGDVVCGVKSGTDWISLDGITFKAEQ